jgi:type IV pilus assembly protein PilB
MTLVKREIGELLVDNGQISPEELKRAEEEKAKSGEPMTVVLSKLGLADEGAVKNALELEYGVSYVSLKKSKPDHDLLVAAGEGLCREYECVPISKDSTRLTLAMVTPTNQDAIEAFKMRFLSLQIKPVVCMEAELASFLSEAFGHATDKPTPEKLGKKPTPRSSKVLPPEPAPPKEPLPKAEEPKVEAPKVEVPPTDESADQAGAAIPSGQEDMAIVLLANHILSNALSRGCTNIHVEPTDKEVLVHYRKDGVLFAARRLPKTLLPFLVSRFKAMAQIPTSEQDLPQDGRLNVQVSGKQLSFRLSIIPAGEGEHLVIWLN